MNAQTLANYLGQEVRGEYSDAEQWLTTEQEEEIVDLILMKGYAVGLKEDEYIDKTKTK